MLKVVLCTKWVFLEPLSKRLESISFVVKTIKIKSSRNLMLYVLKPIANTVRSLMISKELQLI